jgi:hypothetical protein
MEAPRKHLASLLAGVFCVLGLSASAPRAEAAEVACGQLAYTFQPDCYRAVGSTACKQTLEHLDFGPQIAVWIETADHTLVDTLMVTNVTAARGIGNRPGIWNFRSGPKFPYGPRWMSLPIWAYARGKLYPTAVMQDDRHDWMGFHEAHSSKEPYYCRPLTKQEIDTSTDTVTCASPNFNSAKGRLEPSIKSYYPPRNDLTNFINQDCDDIGGQIAGNPPCRVSAATFADLNDLDAVAAATPAYGRPYTRTWHIPSGLPAGDYALVVEVGKEFDTNASHSHPGFEDVAGGLTAYGIDGNFGQPSVVYRVPIRLGGSTPTTAAVSQIAGYSTWPQPRPAGPPLQVTAPLDGKLLARDATISAAVPGSGEARLLEIDGPGGRGRVHVELQRCGTPAPVCDGGACPDGGADADGGAPIDICDPPPPAPLPVSELREMDKDATSATVTFLNSSANGQQVDGYEVRYRVGTTMTEAEFAGAIVAPLVHPDAPGTTATITLPDLKPTTQYMVGVRAIDMCGQRSELVVHGPFTTPVKKFTQLSGCFVATAAYGSELEPQVEALRHARDRLRAGSPLFAAATDLYYRSGPAAADVVGRSDVARALARRVIGPLASLAEALDAATGNSSEGRLSRPERAPGGRDPLRLPK